MIPRWISLFVLYFLAALYWSPATAGDFTVSEAAQACSGLSSVDVQSQGATVKYENYQLSVQTNGSLKVEQGGVLLRKIENFNYSDYAGCVIDLTKTMIGIAAPSQKIPVDIFDEVRVGDTGKTSLSYLDATLGSATDISDDANEPDRKIATYLSDGYVVNALFDPKEGNRILGLRVSIDKSATGKRGLIVVAGYWGHAEPGAVLGVTTMAQGFGDVQCDNLSYDGGILINRDPSFRCAHNGAHDELFVGTSVDMEYLQVPGGDTNEGDAYDLFRLKDELAGDVSPLARLDAERRAQLEKAIGLSSADEGIGQQNKIDQAILKSLGPHVVTGFEIYNSLSGSAIDVDN
jgi:hypothetical protein